MWEVLLITFVVLICVGLVFVFRTNECFLNPTTRVIFFFNGTVTLDANDPFVQIRARQSLLESFSIRSYADIHVCTSKSCIQTFTIPAQTKYTVNLLNDTSVFSFVKQESVTDHLHEVTEYFPFTYSSLPYRISVSTNIQLNQQYTLNDLKQIIKKGTMSVFFSNPSLETKSRFKITVDGLFMPWSTNLTIPDVSCDSCDTIQIMPR